MSNPEDPPRQVIHRTSQGMMSTQGRITEHLQDATREGEQISAIGTIILNWPNFDVWPFKLGIPALGVAAGATAVWMNRVFREALLLGRHMRLTSYIGLSVIAGTGTVILHGAAVTRNILDVDRKQCPVCLQVRASLIQLGCGIAYPFVMAPLMSYMVASAFKDRHLPKVYNKPKEVLGYFKTVLKPLKGNIATIAAAQVILSMGVTYFEQNCFYSTVLPILEGKSSFLKRPDHIKGKTDETLAL